MIRKIVAVAVTTLLVGCVNDPSAHFELESLSAPEQKAFSEAKVMLLGEQHDNPFHHQIQTEILQTLGQQGRLKSVIFEQVDWENQGTLSQLSVSNMHQLPKKLEWDKSGWPDYSLYQPLFETAVKYRARLIAGGLPKNRLEALYKSGYEGAFSAAEIERIKLRTPLDESALGLVRKEIFEGHCKMIPEDHTEKMIPVQRARDAAMVKGYLREADISGVTVFILGNGHARKEFGVPSLLRSIDPNLKIWAVGMQEVETEPFPPEAFDKVWVTKRAEREEDPCAQMKKHIEKKEEKAGESPAEEPKAEETKEEPAPESEPATQPNQESPASDVQDSPAE